MAEPKIEIPDLRPHDTLGGYKATWQEGGMIAYAYLEPFEDQPERGYILETTFQTVSGRKMGVRQQNEGILLAARISALMKKTMVDVGWQPYPIPGTSRVGWQHKSRLKRRMQSLEERGDLVVPKKPAKAVGKQEPIIVISDLQPKEAGVYLATWQEGALIAHAELQPLQDQPSLGYTLECNYNTVTYREPTERQIDTGTTLTSKVRDFMIERLQLAGWREIKRTGNRPIWQHASYLATAQPLQVEQDQTGAVLQQRTLHVAAREDEKRNIKSYNRTITATPITFSCSRCRRETTRTVYPGRAPQYCDACAVEMKREKTRERVARLRAGQKTTQANM